MNIRRAEERDAERIAEIYNWYILNATATFETSAVSADEMKGRIREKLVRYDWLIGEERDELVGYAYYGSFRPRAAYNHTVESTIYLSQENVGKGFGRILYQNLIASAQSRGFREMIGIVALPNPASIELNKRLGFLPVGVIQRAGLKFGKYIDVAIWQKTLAR